MSRDGRPAGNWLTAGAIAIALILLTWGMSERDGWIEMILGSNSGLFWFAVLAWIVCTVGAIVLRRRWWLLLTVPVVFWPLFLSVVLLVACARGNCI